MSEHSKRMDAIQIYYNENHASLPINLNMLDLTLRYYNLNLHRRELELVLQRQGASGKLITDIANLIECINNPAKQIYPSLKIPLNALLHVLGKKPR